MKTSADGKKKWALLTTKPANGWLDPSATELNAGIDPSCNILESDITWGATASDRVNEKTSCQVGNSEGLGAANYDTALTFLRQYLADPAGGVDVEGEDAGYQAVRVRGSEVGIYLRESDKFSTEPWAAGDIIELGGRVVSDAPQRVDNEGSIKRRIPFLPQEMVVEHPVAAGVGG